MSSSFIVTTHGGTFETGPRGELDPPLAVCPGEGVELQPASMLAGSVTWVNTSAAPVSLTQVLPGLASPVTAWPRCEGDGRLDVSTPDAPIAAVVKIGGR